jgi:hypothetical protein
MPTAATPLRTLSASASGAARPRRLRAALAAIGAVAVLGATFALYLRPGLTLDLGQLMAFCGFR